YTAVHEIDILSASEREHLLHALNDIQTDYPQAHDHKGLCLHQLFETQVANNPDNVALVYEDDTLTYRALNQRANRLAHHLRVQGVVTETLVGLCLPRGMDMVVAILAILKAGGAYVPLDPAYPPARLNHMLTDTGLKHLLSEEGLTDALMLSADLELMLLDNEQQALAVQCCSPDNPLPLADLSPSSLAYVIYTSGSTGKPKGVLQTHENVGRLFSATAKAFEFTDKDVWVLFHSIAFDFSVWELWGALNHGAKLLIPDAQCTRDTQQFVALCQQQKVTVLNQTPSAFNMFSQVVLEQSVKLPALRFVIFGGEALQTETLLPWWAAFGEAQPQLINMYGITETTVHVTFKRLSMSDIAQPTIGRVLADQCGYILDREQMLVPLGCEGELYIGGAGLARGYLNQPELTAARFITNPFYDPNEGHGSERLYRTGDLVRYLPDGQLVYIGRADDQVKIRGFRIELGEIEHQLSLIDGVGATVVLVRGDEATEKRLVAYLVATGEATGVSTDLDIRQIKAQLQRSLPDYMVPSSFVVLGTLPLTANGKVDKKALPMPDYVAMTVFEPPELPAEKMLAGIWEQVLGLDSGTIGRQDSFYEQGGHSLLLLQYRSLLNQQGYDISTEILYRSATLSELAQYITLNVSKTPPPALIPVGCQRLSPQMFPLSGVSDDELVEIASQVQGGWQNIEDIYPLSPLQQGMLYHVLTAPNADPYVIKSVFKCDSSHSYQQFLAALNAVIARHDALRTTLVHHQMAAPVQVVCREVTLMVTPILLDLEPVDIKAWLDNYQLPEEDNLCLGDAPLLRLHVWQNHQQYYLVLFNHHLIEDNISLRHISSEMNTYLGGQLADLSPAVQYRHFIWQSMQLDLDQAKQYFTDNLASFDDITRPFGINESTEAIKPLSHYQAQLSTTLVTDIRHISQRQKVSLSALFHLAWAIVLAKTSDQQDIVFGSVLSGRMQSIAGIDQMVGLCINTLPLRVN
ncbi:MAG: amino acid adenylation domain-containing protein, partial [Psychrosphaera sp.]|nr:amino acid adenylation domain-containing protein [Psychrosphaera sp.]